MRLVRYCSQGSIARYMRASATETGTALAGHTQSCASAIPMTHIMHIDTAKAG